jgi:hypothetical protein
VRIEMEATPRIELGMEVLQTSALPLGYVAAPRFYLRRRPVQVAPPTLGDDLGRGGLP